MVPVIFDSKEQKPWVLDPRLFTMEKRNLPTGDYTLAGFEDRICVERKALGDLVSSVIHEWLVHRKRWYRMAGFDMAAVVVEADIGDVIAKRYESEADPMSVLGKVNTIFIDHSVPVFFWGNRTNCTTMVERYLLLAWKKLGGVR
jgi:DNA excision repair protein ERCC-4